MDSDDRILKRLILESETLLHALKIMDETWFRSLIVQNKESRFVGVLSIGDIQRAIIKNISLDKSIKEIVRQNPKIGSVNQSLDDIKEEMLRFRMEFMPIVDDNGILLKVYFWEDLFVEETPPPIKEFHLPVVIMAGGKGLRLKPLTNVLPKPLIPVGDKTIIEEIFKRFASHGSKRFYISVNYKSELIEFYLKNEQLPYELNFFKEDQPMGTAGSLSLLKGKLNETFFVSNCDILIDQDYSQILDYHQSNKNEITIVAAMKHLQIPYGTIISRENGQLVKLEEKPEISMKINSGMYILEPHLLNEIPQNTFFHITHLIDKVLKRNGTIGVFPVSEKSWKDIGEWDIYMKNIMPGK
jgi:dTDP-glucose pyrophosphorylase